MTTFLQIKEEIIAWLEEHQVKNYELMPDETYGFVVNVDGNVKLSHQNLTQIPVKFNQISGCFDCDHNKLTDLKFCPQRVGRHFSCERNQLTSLKFCPQQINEHFYCNDNQLTSLEFCPQQVGGNFNCSYNQLTSLEFCPTHVGGLFCCNRNPLLQDIQKITNFDMIYQEHVKTKIMLAKDQLERKIDKKSSSQEKSKMKI